VHDRRRLLPFGLGAHVDRAVIFEPTLVRSGDPALARGVGSSNLLAWTEGSSDGDGDGIRGVVIGVGGEMRQGRVFQINTHTAGAQRNPVASRAGDGAVVVWESQWQDGTGGGIFGQCLQFDSRSAATIPEGEEFRVHLDPAGSQTRPGVARVSDRSFAVVWQHLEQGVKPQIRARVMTW